MTRNSFLVLAGAIVLSWGCHQRTRTLCFLVDEGFTGVLQISRQANGTKPQVKGEMVYYDATGKTNLLSSNTRFLESFHAVQARYPSGATIYSIASASTPSNYVVRPLFATSSGSFYYYIGPEDQLARVEDDLNARRGMLD